MILSIHQFNIEIYTHSYRTEVADLILHIQKEEFGIPITLDQQPDLNDISGYYQTGNGNFWIAKAGDALVGTIALLDIGNGQVALRKMFVKRNYRGKEWGLGQKLLDTLIDWCAQQKITEIYLGTTEKFLAAQRFYEKNGFKEVKKEELPQNFPVMEVDVKFYMRLLT